MLRRRNAWAIGKPKINWPLTLTVWGYFVFIGWMAIKIALAAYHYQQGQINATQTHR